MHSLAFTLRKPALAERRSTVRLYKIWDTVRGQRDLPLLTNFDLSLLKRFGGDCFLLEIEGHLSWFRYFGRNLAVEIGRDLTGRLLSEVPRYTLLAHVVANCLDAAAQRKAIGLSGSFVKAADQHLVYRGILLPFSTDGATVDALLGFFRSRKAKGSTLSSDSIQETIRPPEIESLSIGESKASPAEPPVEIRMAANRTRQFVRNRVAYEESRPSAGRLLGMIADAWRRVVWPNRVVQMTKNAPAIVKAILVQEASSEFVLLVGRRVEAGRFEVISAANPVLLNLAMRVAVRKLARRSTKQIDDRARIAVARLLNDEAP